MMLGGCKTWSRPQAQAARTCSTPNGCSPSAMPSRRQVAPQAGKSPVGRGAPRGKKAPKKGGFSSSERNNGGGTQQEAMLKALLATKQAEQVGLGNASSSADNEDFVTVSKGSGRTKRQYQKVDGSIYDHPKYYDWAFGYRNFESETDFLFDVYEELRGAEPESFAELGCGPAQHSLEMAESGLKTFCVDISENMLTYAAGLAAEDDLTIHCVHQDIRDFTLPNDEQVDLIAVMFGTFQHMYTNDDALRAMKSIARNLKPGGLFVLEFNHPALLFDGSVVSSADTWSHEVEDAQVEVFFGQEGDHFDSISQVLQKTVRVNIQMRGEDQLYLENIVPMRQYTYQEILLLAECSGLMVTKAYGDFDMESGIQHTIASETDEPGYDPEEEDPYRMILVLQRK